MWYPHTKFKLCLFIFSLTTSLKMSYVYRVHLLPTSDLTLLPFLAGKFASLRLSALTVSAPAFSSTFEIESGFNAPDWIARLQRPLVHYLIAVAYAADTSLEHQSIDKGDWIGSATLIGPITKAAYTIVESGGPAPEGDDVESRWQMTAVFNAPQHRGKGIAKMLIRGALNFHPRNIVVKKLYEGLGFEDAGKCTLAEAYISNGDSNMLPSDGGKSDPEKYLNRLGTIMEKVSVPTI
jgi:GNAT superfamily N-acetyltransferase